MFILSLIGYSNHKHDGNVRGEDRSNLVLSKERDEPAVNNFEGNSDAAKQEKSIPGKEKDSNEILEELKIPNKNMNYIIESLNKKEIISLDIFLLHCLSEAEDPFAAPGHLL